MCASLGRDAVSATCTAGPMPPDILCFLGCDTGLRRNPLGLCQNRLSREHSVQSMWSYTESKSAPPGCPGTPPQAVCLSGFRKRGLANSVSRFFSENETEKNGRKRKKRKKTERKLGKKLKKFKKTEENGKKGKKSEATPFRRPLFCETPSLDDRQITHLICVCLKHFLYDFLRGVFWAFFLLFSYIKAQNTP